MAKMATLQDPFTANALNAALWSSFTGGTSTLSYSEQGASANLPAVATSSDNGTIYSNSTYDLTGSYLAAHITTVPNPATGAYANLQGQIDGNNLVGWLIQSGTLAARYVVTGTITTLVSFPYSPSLHAFWRIRESGGTTFWDTSPDGTNWTNRASAANPITETLLLAQFSASCFEAEISPGSFVLNDLNVFPAIVYPQANENGPVRAKLPYLPGSQQLGAIGGFYGSMSSFLGDTSFGNGRVQWSSGSLPPLLLLNNFEGGTNTTTISTGNSGGASGNAFDFALNGAGGTLAFSTTKAAHGRLSATVATTANNSSYFGWVSSVGVQSRIWFRVYLYFTAIPTVVTRFFTVLNQSNIGCVRLAVLTTPGHIQVQDGNGNPITTSTTVIPLNQWFRVEGFAFFSPNAGKTEVKIFTGQEDSQVPVETNTSTATYNLNEDQISYVFGSANPNLGQGPYYMDDIGLSNTGYLGPASFAEPNPLVTPVRAAIPPSPAALPPRGRVYSNPGSLPALLLLNNFDGGTNTTTVTTGNSGGASGTAFDVVNIPASGTTIFDNTEYAHGSLSGKLATTTAGLVYTAWGEQTVGLQPKLWFREYLYFTAFPGSSQRVLEFLTGSAAAAAGVIVNTAGKVLAVDSAGTTITTSSTSIPLNKWFRIEGFFTGSSNAGQSEVKIFIPLDAQIPVETNTSAATRSTLAAFGSVRWGHGSGSGIANLGPFWVDDVGVSNQGYIGPASFPGAASLGHSARSIIPARVRGGGGIIVRNDETPPFVPPTPPPPNTGVGTSALPSVITTFPAF